MAKEEKNLEVLEDETNITEDEKIKADVEKKIKKQIEKKEVKEGQLGFYRIGEYLKTEHKWENYLFVAVSIITLVLGTLILNGALVVRDDFPLIGDHPNVLAWILIGFASIALLYSLWPFFKPAFPEFKKITWLTLPKFLADAARVFIFMTIMVLMILLFNYLISGLLANIIRVLD
jgi:preprotein translocase subunit SecE